MQKILPWNVIIHFLLLHELMERQIILVRLFERPEDLPAEFCELFKI